MKRLYKFLNFTVVITLVVLKIAPRRIGIYKIPETVIVSLTKDQVFKNGNSSEFAKFLAERRFNLDIVNKSPVIEIRGIRPLRRKTNTSNLIFTRDVHLYLSKCFKIYDLFKLYFEINSSIEMYSSKNAKINLKTFKKDIFNVSVWNILKYKSFTSIKLITTQTHSINLPNIFKVQNSRVCKIMMWYSTNSVPIRKYQYTDSKQYLSESTVNYIDQHFVWNRNHYNELIQQNALNLVIVGSILFYPKRNSALRQNWVTYFDITPISQADSIYTEDSAEQNLLTIVRALEEMNAKSRKNYKLRVKPKRAYTKIHSKRYIKLLHSLKLRGEIQIVDSSSNLYEVISESFLILAPPFSSPIEIGEELGIPGAYFFEEGLDWDLDSFDKVSPILRNKSDLLSWLRSHPETP